MVVKVQLSLFTSEEKRQCMVNSMDGSVIFIMTVTDGVLKIMGHDVKAFFHAEIKNGLLEIGDRAPWQEW